MNSHHPRAGAVAIAFVCSLLMTVPCVDAQPAPSGLDRVLTMTGPERSSQDLQIDRGSTGLWQQLQKLGTTASVMHILAHPDDEHGGVLTYLSRGQGARVAQLTLNRGEGGANAIGSELFDALGMVRTEELLRSGAYYGLDDLYFTNLIDYGYSKTLDESLQNWGREHVLGEVVRAIRINRPFVILSRFHGSERDGHGNHEAAGVIAQEAFRVAGDPSRFPEQISEEGLEPWQPLKLYRGGIRDGEPWTVRIDAGQYGPWLGDSYRNVASRGLAYQRSQTSGTFRQSTGPYVRLYERLDATAETPRKETGLFDGIDTSVPGLFALLEEPAPERALALLNEVQEHVDDAAGAFNVKQPAAVVPSLAQGLEKIREAIALLGEPSEALFHLRVKEAQFMEAINTALGIRLQAVSVPSGATGSDSPWAPSPTMGVAVPGQTFRVETVLLNPSPQPIRVETVRLDASPQWRGASPGEASRETIRSENVGRGALQANDFVEAGFDVTVPREAGVSDRYYYRESIRDSRYTVREPEYRHLPHRPPLLLATADYAVEDVPVEVTTVVQRREANFPYGYEMRELKIAPAVAVNVQPPMRVVSSQAGRNAFDLQVELVNNREGPVDGTLTLDTPPGWTVEPPQQPFSFSQAGQRLSYTMEVTISELRDEDYTVRAVATVDGEEFSQGYDVISHLDNDTQYLFRPAVTQVRGIDVEMASGMQVGYVMGVGDEVPSGIEQLGAEVRLLAREDLATGDLSRFDAIVVGTRAYAVRQDLWTYNQRLLDYAREGGNLVVLYQTPEYVPNEVAPHPGVMPRSPEEVSEEDAPVRILAPDHPVFNEPNEITQADFDDWIEQRGSKFYSEWDDAYTAMIETQDTGQEPQQGAWLTAEYGDGFYTYFALAVHRQLPYGVPGAYRIFANVLSLGR